MGKINDLYMETQDVVKNKINISLKIEDRIITQQVAVCQLDTIQNTKEILTYLIQNMTLILVGDKELEHKILKMMGKEVK